jgi:hypothetical protein
MGLMQLMPQTYAQMALQYGLGNDPYNPHDNIFAGAAYLRLLHARYGYPTMFQAYDDGPGNLEARLRDGRAFLTINPEFGPPPYQPVDPVSEQPLADVWEVCLWMTQRFRTRWAHLQPNA